MSATLQDRPVVFPDSFSASLIETAGAPHKLSVAGEAVGDYRVEEVLLVRAAQQGAATVLVLDVIAKLGRVENRHPDIEKVWPLRYMEEPARHRYSEVKIVNGGQHFTIKVVAAL